MTIIDLGLALAGGAVAGIGAGGLCGSALARKNIGVALGGLMGMFYGALAVPGIVVALLLSLIMN